MAYIGNTVQSTPFITDTFSGDSSTVSFLLTRAPASTASIAVFVGGSYQRPGTYTLSGSTLTFGSAPTSGTNNIVVLHLGNGSATQVPSEGSVTLIKLASDTYSYINSAFTQANTPSYTANFGFDHPISVIKTTYGFVYKRNGGYQDPMDQERIIRQQKGYDTLDFYATKRLNSSYKLTLNVKNLTQTQIQTYITACQAVKTKYPKG